MYEFFDIPGFEGKYQMNTIGQLISLDKWVKCNNGKTFLSGGPRMVSPDGNGYLKVGLSKDGKVFNIRIHILLAKMFIPNPHNYRLVRHLNDIKTDNRLENLAWGTDKHNADDCVRNGHHRSPRGITHHWFGKHRMPPNKGMKGIRANNTKTLLDLNSGIFYYGTDDAAKAKNMNPNTLRSKMSGFVKNNTGLIYV